MKTKGVKDNLLFANACKKKVGGSKKEKKPSMAETLSLLNICQRANFSCPVKGEGGRGGEKRGVLGRVKIGQSVFFSTSTFY